MGAVLQLESFDPARRLPQIPTLGPADLDEAFARGVATGRAEAERSLALHVAGTLAALSADLLAANSGGAAAARHAAQALGPIFEALLDGVIPAVARARLEAALLSELTQLAEAVTPLSALIRCGDDLAPFLSACIAQTGAEAIEVDTGGPPGTVEAQLLGGSITWDVATVTGQLRDLVHEIMEDH